MKKALYIFSGLGADERVFRKLDFSAYAVTHIKWITPLKNESLAEYAKRISTQIKTEKPLIIGLSFGGIMAVEISKIIVPEKIIIIASVKTKYEIPWYFRFLGKLGVANLLPNKLLKSSNFATNWLFGTGGKADKKILKQILQDTDPVFLKWALNRIPRWENETKPKNLVHIHGNADKILPIRFAKPDLVIENGGHLMTLNKAEALNEIILNELNENH
ncbi:MAG: alpha/beta hydrolase [Pedobacter sp.]|nr:MAG: alpha/beta hydrolase [Pedobacter sp.]